MCVDTSLENFVQAQHKNVSSFDEMYWISLKESLKNQKFDLQSLQKYYVEGAGPRGLIDLCYCGPAIDSQACLRSSFSTERRVSSTRDFIGNQNLALVTARYRRKLRIASRNIGRTPITDF